MQVEPIAAYHGNWQATAAAWNSCPCVPATECVCVSVCVCVCVCVSVCLCVCLKLLQSCPTLCDLWTVTRQAPLSMGFHTRILDWVAMPSSRGSFQPRDRTHLLCLLH